MAEITDAELAELRRLHEASTPPERFSVTRYGHGGGRVCAEPRDLVADFYSEADRECWIAARNALPALIARVATLEAALRATFGAYNRCAACGLTPEGISGKAHSEDCLVGAALRGLEGK